MSVCAVYVQASLVWESESESGFDSDFGWAVGSCPGILSVGGGVGVESELYEICTRLYTTTTTERTVVTVVRTVRVLLKKETLPCLPALPASYLSFIPLLSWSVCRWR